LGPTASSDVHGRAQRLSFGIGTGDQRKQIQAGPGEETMTQMDVQASRTDADLRDPVAVIRMEDISIAFGGVPALDHVSLRLFPGEVHALMGENGAGKSTLIKALTGVYSIDSGRIVVDGEEHVFSSPAASQAAGISTVYQEVNLVPNLTVAENMLLGREPRKAGGIDTRAMNRQAKATLSRLGIDIEASSLLGGHPIAIQQLVAIARAVDTECRVLILDEPTSSLDADEVKKLFEVMRHLRDQGVAIVFVSHFLDQIYEISDRMTILRNGKLVEERMVKDTPQLQLVRLMIGRELQTLENLDREAASTVKDTSELPVLTAVGLGRRGSLEATDLKLYEGEVIGIAGLLGSGRTELARLLFGADTADSGELQVRSTKRRFRSPRHAIDRKIAFTSENRRSEGVVGDLTVADNMLLALQASRGWMRPIPQSTRTRLVNEYIEALDIRPADPNAIMRNLSGGNQQKVLLARWLITQPEVLILDEPTRGIDIGAKAHIQQLVAELSSKGLSVVFISAELEEVLRLSDRLVVMRDRRKIDERPNNDISVSDVLEIIAGEGRAEADVEESEKSRA
jgi:simple sugar transport system ATP-binding protein